MQIYFFLDILQSTHYLLIILFEANDIFFILCDFFFFLFTHVLIYRNNFSSRNSAKTINFSNYIDQKLYINGTLKRSVFENYNYSRFPDITMTKENVCKTGKKSMIN